MVVVVDISMMVRKHHAMSTSEDDVPGWILHKLEVMRSWFSHKFDFQIRAFVCAFDNPERILFRNLLLDTIEVEYKAGRQKSEEIPLIEADTLAAVRMDSDWQAVVAGAMFEADDVCASIAAQYPGKVIICSADRDYHTMIVKGRVQLVKRAASPEPGASLEVDFFNADALMSKYGLRPDQWIDYQCMVGGKDNVPGWAGVGDKKAMQVIESGVDLRDVDVECEDLKLNKKQRETYRRFQMDYPVIKAVRTPVSTLMLDIKLKGVNV